MGPQLAVDRSGDHANFRCQQQLANFCKPLTLFILLFIFRYFRAVQLYSAVCYSRAFIYLHKGCRMFFRRKQSERIGIGIKFSIYN